MCFCLSCPYIFIFMSTFVARFYDDKEAWLNGVIYFINESTRLSVRERGKKMWKRERRGDIIV